mmetsp:Transcript_19467/g.40164  ORF Transcript_19467/g.40164 Transcript_19467/m.40164 type:complete len:188 (-) Transcript_19467:288-851(-)
MFSSSVLRIARAAASYPAVGRVSISAARRTVAASPAVSPSPAATSSDAPPSVFDKIVKITLIDPSGARRVIPAYVGQTLYDACSTSNVDLGPSSIGSPQQKVRSSTWTEPLYGEGATSGFDHVILQSGNKGVQLVEPPHSNEIKMLEVYWDDDEIFPESRLASQVEISKDMDGLVVYVPDRIVDDIP